MVDRLKEAWPSFLGLLVATDHDRSPLERSRGWRRRPPLAHAEQVVRGADVRGRMLRPGEVPKAGLAQATDRFALADDCFHALGGSVDSARSRPGWPAITARRAPSRPLRRIRTNVALAQLAHEVCAMIARVHPTRARTNPPAGVAAQPGPRHLPFDPPMAGAIGPSPHRPCRLSITTWPEKQRVASLPWPVHTRQASGSVVP
ncbi:MAG: hypothetical protein ACK4VP_03805 [Nitrospira sp.]